MAEENGEQTFVRITNAMVYSELQAVREDLRALSKSVSDFPEVKKNVRKLELKFYGILAGLLSAIIVMFATYGGAG